MSFNFSLIRDGVEGRPFPPAKGGRRTVLAEPPEQYVVTKEYSTQFAVLAVRNIITKRIMCATDHFILSSMTEPDQERTSFSLTFGDPTLYTGMGRNPRIYSYGGILVDSLSSGPNISQWQWMYDNYYRGTMCARRRALVELTTRDLIRKGLMLSCTLSVDATRPRAASFSFNMFVIKES